MEATSNVILAKLEGNNSAGSVKAPRVVDDRMR